MYCDTDTQEKKMHQKYISTIISSQSKPYFLDKTKKVEVRTPEKSLIHMFCSDSK